MATRREFLGTAAVLGGSISLRAPLAEAGASVPWRPQPQFLQPVAQLTVVPGGHTLSLGWCGTKVNLVQQRLGLAFLNEEYDARTRSRVMDFQRARRLPVTGVVDARTWTALATGWRWTVDGWRPPVVAPVNASRVTRVETMVGFATAQVGAPYVWGAAGPKPLGYDCSGLALAAMSAAGLDPLPVTVTLHQSPGYVTTEHLYHHPRLDRVPVWQRRRGDLVFWQGSNGLTRHVAIYLGSGRMVEAGGHAVGTRVTWLSATRVGSSLSPWAVRPFTLKTR